MDPEITDQILDELFPVFQNLETQNAAILQFLKDKAIASDEELAPYLEKARDTSTIRWRVARIRVAKLLALAEKKAEQEASKIAEKAAKETADKSDAGRARKADEKAVKEQSGDTGQNKPDESKAVEERAAKENIDKSGRAAPDQRHASDKERGAEAKQIQASDSGQLKLENTRQKSATKDNTNAGSNESSQKPVHTESTNKQKTAKDSTGSEMGLNEAKPDTPEEKAAKPQAKPQPKEHSN